VERALSLAKSVSHGANTPPIKTPEGWMVLHHGVSPADRYYRIGAMLLDLNDPSAILHRMPDSIMEPTEDFETKGLYNGVVFPFGTVDEVRAEVREMFDTYFRTDGRFMFTLGNGATPDTPIASLEALFEEAYECGQGAARR